MSVNYTFETEYFSHDLEIIKQNVDTFFLILMGSLVFLLKPAFAFFELSFVRPKNAVSVLFRNYLDTIIVVFAYGLTGYGLTFGKSNGFCGTEFFALVNLPDDRLAHFFFMFTFAATAATITSGVVHERCSMTAYVCYTILISGFIFPIATHWAMKEGWLHEMGFDDYAFGTMVHALSGAASLAAAYIAGPRMDRFDSEGKINHIPQHSVPAAGIGIYSILLGMIAFNAGSNGSISQTEDGSTIAKVILNMMICITGSTVASITYHRFMDRNPSVRVWDLENGYNGSLVGMMVVCGGSNQYQNWSSFVVGVIAYFAFLITRKIVRKFKIDDVLDSISLHIGAGFWGTLAVPIFKNNGLLLNWSKASAYNLLINIVGGLVIMLWSFSIMLILYIGLRFFGLHRVSNAEEIIGLDTATHNEKAYSNNDTLVKPNMSQSIRCRRSNRVEPVNENVAHLNFRAKSRITL